MPETRLCYWQRLIDSCLNSGKEHSLKYLVYFVQVKKRSWRLTCVYGRGNTTRVYIDNLLIEDDKRVLTAVTRRKWVTD